MDNPSTPQSNTRRWHRLIEHYTPDGALGRFLLAVASGSGSTFFFFVTAMCLAETNLLLFFLSPLWAGMFLGMAMLTIVTLWPVYLSLIGNVDSAKDYPRKSSSYSRQGASPMDESDELDSMEVLKREYAVGNISESEFERRLNTLLQAEGITEGSQYLTREMERK